MKTGYVYIMSNKLRTTIYIGVTSDIEIRVLEHKRGIGAKFTTKYKLVDLLYFEEIEGVHLAIDREKQLKRWHKDWKWNLIKEQNPQLDDLAKDWYNEHDFNALIERDPETSSG